MKTNVLPSNKDTHSLQKKGDLMSRSKLGDEHFVVSYELLKLLQWFIEHEQDTLKTLLAEALNKGFKEELLTVNNPDKEQSIEHLQENIIDFFTLLETLIHETAHEHEAKHHIQQTMIPAIYHIDTNTCDATSVALSVAKATAAVENKTGENPKDVLCKELLRRWKPLKKPYAH